MRIRYLFLLTELVLLFFFVAPIFKRIINAGNFCGAFACVVLLAATWFCHPLWQAIRRLWTHLAGKIGICAVSLVLPACSSAVPGQCRWFVPSPASRRLHRLLWYWDAMCTAQSLALC